MGIFNNKKSESSKSKERKQEENEIIKLNERPRICCFDIQNNVIEQLSSSGFNIYSGTLGNKIRVPNYRQHDNHLMLLKYDFPPNLHEYDLFILDLANCNTTDYNSENHIRKNHTGKSAISLLSSFPETIFDPRPIASLILNTQLRQVGERPHIVVVFASESYNIEYEKVKQMLEPVAADIKIEKNDIIEIISEPFKNEKAKVVRVDKPKNECVVSLLGAAVPIPVTVKLDNVRVIRREEEDE